MLIKEYRIIFPMSVEEYKIGQLYMIQKSSRIESGNDSGVEIITNEPYTNGPGGGAGQYTYKIYHIGNRLPSWMRNVLPSNALQANEEAWNAYPFTRTRYSSPLMDRFSIEIETLYFNDAGTQDNVFNLSESELKQRNVDVMDFVKEPFGSDYCEEEDPKIYKSKKTGRGPLTDDWIKEYGESGKSIMCAYKLCKVEFRYWGMQTRVERWIHDWALRGYLLKSHRRAWAWQDEWVGLTMADIRRLEDEAALYLSKVMSNNKKTGSSIIESDSSSDIFYDCYDNSPVESHKPSLIRWSSELLVDDVDSSPSTPKLTNSSLLILVFHGDIFPEVPAESKVTDANTLKSVIDLLIQNHYPQLKNRVHVVKITCGSELAPAVSSFNALCPSFGAFHPSSALLLASSKEMKDAIKGTISKANKAIEDFYKSPAGDGFCGEIFTIGDCIGGLLMYEALSVNAGNGHLPISRHSSSLSTQSRAIPEGKEDDSSWSLHDFDTRHARFEKIGNVFSPRNSSVPPMSAPPQSSNGPSKKMSTSSMDTPHFLEINSNNPSFRLNQSSTDVKLTFRASTAFLLGCPLGLVLTQRKLNGKDIDALECNQLLNLYYSLDACGARLEPVLNPQLALLPSVNLPRYQRFPLGDGKHLLFDQTTSLCNTATLWGNRRIDHQLYCPQEMASLPLTALPNILHASYWESKDVGAFILRQFVRSDETHACASFSTTGAMNTSMKLDVPPAQWSRKRTRFKVANLSANHRANDIIVIEGDDQKINAKFCYGPMDLVALSRERVLVYVCPYGGDWRLNSSEYTDNHGRLVVNLEKQLPVGIHTVKMIVGGDHSFLDMYIAVVPQETKCVVFSIDGSLTASVSVTGRDPRVRPGAVDVVRFWQQQGYLILYVSARPDMQQKVVGSWLAQHNFPHGLLFFTPSISTDPLRQKTLYLRHLIDSRIKIQAAYGSSKDVSVCSNAGVEPDRIFSVSGSKRKGCIYLEDGYSQHLHDLHSGRIHVAQPIVTNSLVIDNTSFFTQLSQRHSDRSIQRTHSFTPRSGKYDSLDVQYKKNTQLSNR